MSPEMSPEMSTDDGPLVIRRRAGQPSRRVPRRLMREFLDAITRRVARGRGVVCLITDDRELRRLNGQFLKKDYATDVLSFPAGDGLGDGRGVRAGTRSLAVAPHHKTKPARKPACRQDWRPHIDGRDSIGEIAISVDRAAAQAKEQGHSLADELRILMLHGALHLAGFDHEKDSGEMRRAEARWRKRFGLPLGLIERETARVMVQPMVPSRNGRARP